jgi:aspartyl/asparaginyl-tRNA synthetase
MNTVAHSGGVGASLSVTGMVVASPAKGQNIEIHAVAAKVLGNQNLVSNSYLDSFCHKMNLQ